MDTTKLSTLKFSFVVIDFGSAYIKCGFAGSTKPHAFIQTPHNIKSYLMPNLNKAFQITGELRDILAKFIRHLYTDWLLIDPRTKKVAIIENIFSTSTLFKETLAKAILIDLKAPALLFIPSHIAVIHTIILAPLVTINPVISQPSNTYESGDKKMIPEFPSPFMSARMLSSNCTTPNTSSSVNRYTMPCALVIDCGYSQITILPIADGVPLLFIAKECPRPSLPTRLAESPLDEETHNGAPALSLILKQLLIEELSQNVAAATSNSMKMLENGDFVDDLVARICFVASLKRSVLYDDLYGPREIVQPVNVPTSPPPDVVMDQYADFRFNIPGRLREAPCEAFFRPNLDGESLASAIVDCITQCPLDCRKAMAENLIITGGLSMIPGFKNRLKEEMKLIVNSCDKLKDLPYLQTFKCHALPCPANFASWLGGSIFTAATTTTTTSISNTGNIPSPNTLSILARYRSNIMSSRDHRSTSSSGSSSSGGDNFDNLTPFLIDLPRLQALRGKIPDWTSLDTDLRPYYTPLGTFSVKGG